MKTNNRPMVVEETQYEWTYNNGQYGIQNFYSSEDQSEDGWTKTGNVKVVERPMNDTEYIEYLEEQVSDTFGKLVSVEELSKQTISTLEKENKELKGRLKLYE